MVMTASGHGEKTKQKNNADLRLLCKINAPTAEIMCSLFILFIYYDNQHGQWQKSWPPAWAAIHSGMRARRRKFVTILTTRRVFWHFCLFFSRCSFFPPLSPFSSLFFFRRSAPPAVPANPKGLASPRFSLGRPFPFFSSRRTRIGQQKKERGSQNRDHRDHAITAKRLGAPFFDPRASGS